MCIYENWVTVGRRVGSGAPGQKLLKARRGSGHTIGFKQNCSFKIKRPESGGSRHCLTYFSTDEEYVGDVDDDEDSVAEWGDEEITSRAR